MKKNLALVFISSFLVVGCIVPAWLDMFDRIEYEDLERRPVYLCLDGEKFMTEKDKRERRLRMFKIPEAACASLAKTEDGSRFNYIRNIPVDCDFADSLHLRLYFNDLPSFPETGVKYVSNDPEFNKCHIMSRIDFLRGGRSENSATESWIQFTVIDTLNKVVSGMFEFNAKNIHNEDLTYSVTEGVFENIPLIYK